MGENDIHESAARLYEAAKRAGVTGKSAVARALDESPQAVNNWEARGISIAGALKAQARFGCDANWVRDGTGTMLPGWPFRRITLSAILALGAEDRAYVEGAMARALEELSHAPSPADVEQFNHSHIRMRKPASKRRSA
jgi:hypothetical protein